MDLNYQVVQVLRLFRVVLSSKMSILGGILKCENLKEFYSDQLQEVSIADLCRFYSEWCFRFEIHAVKPRAGTKIFESGPIVCGFDAEQDIKNAKLLSLIVRNV